MGSKERTKKAALHSSRFRIFASTWNLGEVSDVKEVGCLSKWIPANGGAYDVLAIGMQESSISNELLSAIHSHLG